MIKIALLAVLTFNFFINCMEVNLFDRLSNEMLTLVLGHTMPDNFKEWSIFEFMELGRVSISFYNALDNVNYNDTNMYLAIKKLVDDKDCNYLMKIENALPFNKTFSRSFYQCFVNLYCIKPSISKTNFSKDCLYYFNRRVIIRQENKDTIINDCIFIILWLRASCFSTIFNKFISISNAKNIKKTIQILLKYNPVHMHPVFNKLVWNCLLYASLKKVRNIDKKELFLYTNMCDVFHKNDTFLLEFSKK